MKVRYRLWTKTEWVLFEVKETRGGSTRVDIADRGNVAIKRVPCFFADHLIGENLYWAPGLIDEIAYLDRATANYLSNLDAIIQDQTFSQLAMPAQSVLPGEKGYDALIEAGTKRTFLYDSEGGEPKFLSPDPKQAQLIITVVNKIIAEIYQTAGASGERTKQDNAVGIDNSSGVAKAYDFDKLNSLLTSKAQSLQQSRTRSWSWWRSGPARPCPRTTSSPTPRPSTSARCSTSSPSPRTSRSWMRRRRFAASR